MIEARRQSVKSSGVHINFDAVKCVVNNTETSAYAPVQILIQKIPVNPKQTVQETSFERRVFHVRTRNKPDVHLLIEPILRNLIPPVQNLHTFF